MRLQFGADQDNHLSFKKQQTKFNMRIGQFFHRQYVILLLAATVAGCSKEGSNTASTGGASTPMVLKEQSYGTGSRQKADVYLPAGRNKDNTRVLIVIHGGSWIEGDKADLNPYVPLLQSSLTNTAIVNINYTLANGVADNRHPRQMEDIKKVIEWIDANAGTWGVGNTRMLLGVSSGAHISLLYSYAFDTNKRVKAVASFVGPTNLADPYYTSNTLFQNLALAYLGKTWTEDSALHKQVSPLWQVTAAAPPTFMAYAGLDVLVPTTNGTALRDRLTALAVPKVFELYANEGHEMSMPASQDAIQKLAVFADQYAN
jgi:acetyl esterase/lipase